MSAESETNTEEWRDGECQIRWKWKIEIRKCAYFKLLLVAPEDSHALDKYTNE